MINYEKMTVSTQDLFPFISEALHSGQKVIITVSGTSMLPFIAHNRDQVLIAGTDNKQLKPGDIILYQNIFGQYILHRIYKKDKDGYHTIGDSCLREDGAVPPIKIIGVVEKIYRKEKEIDCASCTWQAVFWVWRRMLPIRKYLLGIYFFLVYLKGRIKKKNHVEISHE